ncbi:IclR family transcriptional regulator [Cognatiyoonia sp. IB215182]|uniref:IclR family transcriptional regulator n=1 Tax=Cognatiyoonia sp. IB215182 TaxID=3097353 RepID=UPI002A15DD5E|nr:IclR family transcriptional regulator [Cognatiyoonia sp. IB215182]MDX8353893.1 IclR family transcriptional regulator [Cognatiyoonia sp. IB215182]
MGRVTGDGTVGKALEVLDQVAAFGRPVKFSELLAGSAFPKPTLYRFVQTLTNQQMLSYDPERQTYAPGVRLVRLAHAAWEQSTLAPLARPHIDALSRAVGETVHLAQLDHAQVLYIDKRNAGNPVQMYSQAGKVGPAYCTGVGKVMLAFSDASLVDTIIEQQSFHVFTPQTLSTPDALRDELQKIKANGYGFDREEHEPGIICVAVPILTENGRVLGALSVTSTTSRTNLAGLEGYVPILQDTAEKIARDARNWSFPDYDTKETTRT